MEVVRINSFDGQVVKLDNHTDLYEVGNYLGGGAAGTVYECEYIPTHIRYALKVLNPIGYKITQSSLLRRCTIIARGKVFNDSEIHSTLAKENVWWLVNGPTNHFQACFYSQKRNCLQELSLNQCMDIFGIDPPTIPDEEGVDVKLDVIQEPNGQRYFVPSVPYKYADFVRKRRRIFREIRNMRKISNHPNVIKLESVLELVQDSKCTIFLVMELANGGELFDRIKIDHGTREETAKVFFRQLLDGVKHCHDQGVCHRDLKPENLLLQDDGHGNTLLKIADFGFSAHFHDDLSKSGWDSEPGSYSEPGSLGVAFSPARVLKSIVGSPFYVAPEVIQARGYDGQKADVWSIGVILYAMLAGNLPFGQDLATCKRFKSFCKWIRETDLKGTAFWTTNNVDYPSWLFPAKFSNSAKGLIVAMLHPDPECRVSLIEAMSHVMYTSTSPSILPRQILQSETVSESKDTNVMEESISYAEDSARLLREMRSSDGEDQEDNDECEVDNVYNDEVEVFEMDQDVEESPTCSLPTPVAKAIPIPPQPPVQEVIAKSAPFPTKGVAVLPDSDIPQSFPELLIENPNYTSAEMLKDMDSPPQQGGGHSPTRLGDSRGNGAPPSFHDMVKRSTRFMTAVPAGEVLTKVESLLNEVKRLNMDTPLGKIGKVQLDWNNFRLDVWTNLDYLGPSACALQLYQMPSSSDPSGSPAARFGASPSQSIGSWYGASSLGGVRQTNYVVEFIRGQVEIFVFKRFYQWVRLKLSELVKRDYDLKLFDQAGSPYLDSFLRR